MFLHQKYVLLYKISIVFSVEPLFLQGLHKIRVENSFFFLHSTHYLIYLGCGGVVLDFLGEKSERSRFIIFKVKLKDNFSHSTFLLECFDLVKLAATLPVAKDTVTNLCNSLSVQDILSADIVE